jgi:plasmid stabilization system protein ParE
MIPVRLDEEAAQELRNAYGWYETRVAGLGDDFLAAVESAIARIERRPRAFGFAPGVPRRLHVRRLVLEGFPFTIFFTVLATEIRVLAIAHQRRKPGYWR